MDSKIPKIPELPKEIIEAAKEDRLVIFVGTGPSRLMGAAGWNEFANNVLKQLIEEDIIDYAFIDQLNDLDARKKLSIARSRADEEGIRIKYEESIMPSEEYSRNSKIYNHLLGIGSHFVTTNYDNYLDQPTHRPFDLQDESEEKYIKSKNIIYDPSDLNKDSLSKPNTVVHLHGSFSSENQTKLVVTTPDYLKLYYEDNDSENGVRDFLNELFGGSYTILFLGYGLNELEILEYILSKSENSLNGKRQRSRFWLQGCFTHQKNTYEQLKKYYDEAFDIEMLLYSLDRKKYKALEDIIAEWKIKINKEITPTTEQIRFVNEVLDDE